MFSTLQLTADLTGLHLYLFLKGIGKGRFPNTGRTCNNRCFALKHFLNLAKAFPFQGT